MTVRIDIDQIVRRYLATGAAAVVVVLSPAPGTSPGSDTNPPAATTVTVAPVPPGTPSDGAAGGTSAAETLGWGEPVRADEFEAGIGQWSLYDGPGHAGKGRRSPDAVSVHDGVPTITGDSSGTTGGMSWGDGRRYGRWEARVRAPAADPSYNALLLLWPDAEDFPIGGEIDFMEMMDHTRQKTHVFLHYGEDNKTISGSVVADATQWHNWAVEWTPTHIATYLDGEEWWRTERTEIFPPRPMHLCIQLDWFPHGGTVQASTMHVDWVREYDLDGG